MCRSQLATWGLDKKGVDKKMDVLKEKLFYKRKLRKIGRAEELKSLVALTAEAAAAEDTTTASASQHQRRVALAILLDQDFYSPPLHKCAVNLESPDSRREWLDMYEEPILTSNKLESKFPKTKTKFPNEAARSAAIRKRALRHKVK